MYRQGEVQLVQVSSVPEHARRVARWSLAVPGFAAHGHNSPWGAQFFETEEGVGFVKVSGSFIDLPHEEHGTIRLVGPAVYRVEPQRELVKI